MSIDADARPRTELFTERAEERLWQRVCEIDDSIGPLIVQQDFAGILERLSELRQDVDSFFDTVMVMSEDHAIRENRLILLNRLQALFLNVADISTLQ